MILRNNTLILYGLACVLGLSACSDNDNDFTPPEPDTTAPEIGMISDFTIDANTSSDAVTLSLSDDGTSLSDLAIEITSSNTMLISNDGVDIQDRTAFVVTPNPDTIGEAVISLSVSDHYGNTAMESFTVTVVTREVAAIDLVNEIASLGEDDEPVYLNAVEVSDQVSAETGFDALVNQ